ncbi:MAG: 23S rRNA (adenine(2030)-N(6))-methyltransferase RlmJ [Methanotrichaceae archaeon]|nr:23S rRNA (adenine(2030)-N(6))-methyltransferase RlmJ [Methanotrichaceae archaeon]
MKDKIMGSEKSYNHRTHAGNAGDVWKHFLLGEVADYLLSKKRRLVYAESHVGYPKYRLEEPEEWEGGIGKCWPKIMDLKAFSYFKILSAMNPQSLEIYPGSASLIFKVARWRGAVLQAELWDEDPRVAGAWRGTEGVSFHLGDGFKGVRALLGRSPPGLLFIDPPYLDQKDLKLVLGLLNASQSAGWIVLWWQMMGHENFSSELERFSLEFRQAGLDGGQWIGSVVSLASSDQELKKLLERRIQQFLEIMRPAEQL